MEALVSNRRREVSSLKQEEEGRVKPQGNELGWGCRVRPTLEASLCIITMWETHLKGAGTMEKIQVTWSFAKKKKHPKNKTLPFFNLGIVVQHLGRGLQTTVLPLDNPGGERSTGSSFEPPSHTVPFPWPDLMCHDQGKGESTRRVSLIRYEWSTA